MSIYRKMDIKDLCRFCMRVSNKKHDLYKSQESFDRELLSKVEKCIPLKIKENDILPKEICENCIKKIEAFYKFINKCEYTESMLKIYWASLSVSDQLECQKKESIENNFNDKFISSKKSVDSNSSMLTMQSLSNLVQSDLTQINNDTNGQYQTFCEYKKQPCISTTNKVKSKKRTRINANNSNGLVQTESFNEENSTSENAQTIHSTSNSDSSSYQEDNNINIYASTDVTSLIVEPEMLYYEFNKSDNEQDSNMGTSKSEICDDAPTYPNYLLPKDIALISCTACGKVLESKEEIAVHNHMCEAINNDSVPISSQRDMMLSPFSCKFCSKEFKKKDHLAQHIKIHSNERPYNCEICSKSFIRKEHLTRHISCHTGQRLYGCHLCPKQFNRKDNRHKHLITHGLTGPITCQICGKSFKLKRNYDIHYTTHNEIADSQTDGQTSAISANNGLFQVDI